MKKDTFIFDLDGTLLNTLEDLGDSVNFALRTKNCPERTYDEIRSFVGNGVRMLMKRSVPEKTSDEDYEEMFSSFRNHYLENMYNKTAPYMGIPELLNELKKRNVKIGVVSNKLDTAVKKLCRDFFPGMIDCAQGAKGEKDRKPAPDNVFLCMEKLGSDKESCVYIGDSEVDIMTAENAGLDCVCVTWGFRTREELKCAGGKIIADTAEEILNLWE